MFGRLISNAVSSGVISSPIVGSTPRPHYSALGREGQHRAADLSRNIITQNSCRWPTKSIDACFTNMRMPTLQNGAASACLFAKRLTEQLDHLQFPTKIGWRLLFLGSLGV